MVIPIIFPILICLRPQKYITITPYILITPHFPFALTSADKKRRKGLTKGSSSSLSNGSYPKRKNSPFMARTPLSAEDMRPSWLHLQRFLIEEQSQETKTKGSFLTHFYYLYFILILILTSEGDLSE